MRASSARNDGRCGNDQREDDRTCTAGTYRFAASSSPALAIAASAAACAAERRELFVSGFVAEAVEGRGHHGERAEGRKGGREKEGSEEGSRQRGTGTQQGGGVRILIISDNEHQY